MKIKVLNDLHDLGSAQWNHVLHEVSPFLRHEFLAAMESYGCVGRQWGWLPQHIAMFHESGELLGAVPMYIKLNSYGELVFDWAWAEAYQRAGLVYYPKLVIGVPYTPVTGSRLLVSRDADYATVANELIAFCLDYAKKLQVSSVHWLFPTMLELALLESHGFKARMACQFHWENQGYHSFDDFLSRLSSRKRKKIKSERQQVWDQQITFRQLSGDEAIESDWRSMEYFYRNTFISKGGFATFNLEFFKNIGHKMGQQIVLIFAEQAGKDIAGAFFFRDSQRLYGRYWGTTVEMKGLHFETCYYQGIEYAIQHGLQVFEPGAQGEHKISRGFLPTATWSAHWIADPRFRVAIDQFIEQEVPMMEKYCDELSATSPYRRVGN